jgi:hypothetical protein
MIYRKRLLFKRSEKAGKLNKKILTEESNAFLSAISSAISLEKAAAGRYNSTMSLDVEKKWLKNVLLGYLIFAIIGSFAFSTGQAFSYEKADKDILGSNVYFSSINRSVDWLAVDTPSISKSNRYSNSPLRNILFRVFALSGIIGIAVFLAKTNFKTNKNDNIPIIKNLVLLKLRI